MSNKYILNLDDDGIKGILAKFNDLNLEEHYDFKSGSYTSYDDREKIKNFLQNNKPIKFEINESNFVYYKLEKDDESKIFDIDVEKSFVKSDLWLYDKIYPVTTVFPTIMDSEVSNEMTGFYTCLVIASVFGGAFEDELLEVADVYNFDLWCPNDESQCSMSDLVTSWIQLGSKYIKLVAAAAKYALVRERNKKTIPSALQLPMDTVLELNKTIREVEQVRYEFDNFKLSDEIRSKLSRLQIKMINAEKESKIQSIIERDPKILQIWRLTNLNSNVIPPNILLRINREAKRSALELFQNVENTKGIPDTRDERLLVKQLESKYKKIVRRAYLNKLFSDESKKFILNPNVYIAPNFL